MSWVLALATAASFAPSRFAVCKQELEILTNLLPKFHSATSLLEDSVIKLNGCQGIDFVYVSGQRQGVGSCEHTLGLKQGREINL
jgi:hypothetical protein